VAAGEQAYQEAFDHVFLTDNYTVHLSAQLLDKPAFVSDFLVDFVNVRSEFHFSSLNLNKDDCALRLEVFKSTSKTPTLKASKESNSIEVRRASQIG
jgi:hypothetical protein